MVRFRAFLDTVLHGFLTAFVLAVLGYALFSLTGCAADLAPPVDPATDDAEVWNGLGDTGWPAADDGAPDGGADDTSSDALADVVELDTRPAAEADTRPAPDTTPVDTALACPSGVYCTFATGAQGRVGAPCFDGAECCSGACYDEFPGDGVKGACIAGTGKDWCGTSAHPEWCPGAPDKVCAK